MKEPKRIAVLYGGVSGEHEVSVRSAQSVMRALQEAGYDVLPVYIGKDGAWRLDGGRQLSPGAALPMLSGAEGAASGGRPLLPGGSDSAASASTSDSAADLVFPVLHGTLGEDGALQGLLEVAEMPYVGSGVLGSAVGMDKIAQKLLLRASGLPVVDFATTTRAEIRRDVEAVADRLERGFEFPMFVKPANLGSSVGITKARTRAELRPALLAASRYDRRVIVEQGVDARELEVSVLGNDEPAASAVGEVIPGREFYDYEAKYADAGSRTEVPANIPADLSERVRGLAIEAFLALDLAGMARVDFLLDRHTGDLYLSEANTIPGFTDISMFAKLWGAGGLDFPALVSQLVSLGWERYQDRQLSLATVRADSLPPGDSAGGRPLEDGSAESGSP